MVQRQHIQHIVGGLHLPGRCQAHRLHLKISMGMNDTLWQPRRTRCVQYLRIPTAVESAGLESLIHFVDIDNVLVLITRRHERMVDQQNFAAQFVGDWLQFRFKFGRCHNHCGLGIADIVFEQFGRVSWAQWHRCFWLRKRRMSNFQEFHHWLIRFCVYYVLSYRLAPKSSTPIVWPGKWPNLDTRMPLLSPQRLHQINEKPNKTIIPISIFNMWRKNTLITRHSHTYRCCRRTILLIICVLHARLDDTSICRCNLQLQFYRHTKGHAWKSAPHRHCSLHYQIDCEVYQCSPMLTTASRLKCFVPVSFCITWLSFSIVLQQQQQQQQNRSHIQIPWNKFQNFKHKHAQRWISSKIFYCQLSTLSFIQWK